MHAKNNIEWAYVKQGSFNDKRNERVTSINNLKQLSFLGYIMKKDNLAKLRFTRQKAKWGIGNY